MALTCVVKAEPAPTRFILKFPSQHNVFINSQHRINGIKWQIILRLKSMNCLNTGSYSFEPHNSLGSNGSVSVKLAISGECGFDCSMLLNPSASLANFQKGLTCKFSCKQFIRSKRQTQLSVNWCSLGTIPYYLN